MIMMDHHLVVKKYQNKVEIIVPGIEVKNKSYDIRKIQNTLDKSICEP